ncbi:MAG: hypothetical protein HOV94_10020 [Saccharothrix sp.]|nr:hypothetical protein [Saccharothrix sp.]
MRRATGGPGVRDDLVLLAADAVGNAPAIDPAVRDEVTEWTSRLLPPPSFEDAVKLAGIGEPVLDVLPDWHTADSAGRGPYLIRLVAEVGGEAALATLAGYTAAAAGISPPSAHVTRAFYAAWDYFDDVEYARTVLAHVPPAAGVVIGTEHRLAAAALLPHVPWAVVDGRPGLLAGLARITGLTAVLVLAPDDAALDLGPVSDCRALASLHVIAPGHAVRWRTRESVGDVDAPAHGIHFDVFATCGGALPSAADVDLGPCRGRFPVTLIGFGGATLPSDPTRE